jgi:3-(3-hydroxy-phenyl)propionate hydroxylase
LLGDAAHLTPPFAGQGMNAGLRDAFNVAWKVALFIREQASLKLLQSYETERRDGIWAMIQLAVTMGEIIMPRNDQDRAIRAALLEKLNAFPGGREYVLGMRFKPRPRFTTGTLVDFEHFTVPASLVGCMVPQPRVSARGKTWMLDELLGTGFALLAQSPEVARFAMQHREQLWPELAPVLIHLAGPAGHEPPCDDGAGSVIQAVSLTPSVAAALKAHRDQLLLVRPDRYAATAFWPHHAAEAVAAFRARLQP